MGAKKANAQSMELDKILQANLPTTLFKVNETADQRYQEAVNAANNGDTGPILRQELKLRILKRRHNEGLPDLTPDFQTPPNYELTPAEKEKKERRKEQNRRAAKKCRERKKSHQQRINETYQKELDKKHKLIKSRDALKNYLSSLETILFTHMAVCSFFPNRQGQQQQPPPDTHHSHHQDLPQLSMVLGGESFQPCNVSGLQQQQKPQQQHAVLSSANGPPLTSLNSQSNRAQAVTVNSGETPATNFFSFSQSCADQEQTENSCPDADPIAAPPDSNNVTNLGHQEFILSSTDMVAAISELVEDWNSGVILDENHSPDAHYTALYSQPTPMVASSWALEGEGGPLHTFGHSNNSTIASPHARHSGFEPEIQNISASSSEAPRNAVTLEISKGDDQLLEKRDYGDIYPLISAANSRDNVLFRRSKSQTRSDYNGHTRTHSNPGMNSFSSILSHQPVYTLSESRSRHVVPGSVEGTPPESPGTGVADEVMLIESETECSLSIPELPSEAEPCLSFSDFLDCLRQKQI